MPAQKMPVMSIKNRKDINKLFKDALEQIKKNTYHLSDMSLHAGKGADGDNIEQKLKNCQNNFETLNTDIQNTLNTCVASHEKPYSTLSEEICKTKKQITTYFGTFIKNLREYEFTLLTYLENFLDHYNNTIESLDRKLTNGIKATNKDLLDAPFKHNNQEISLESIIDQIITYLVNGTKTPYFNLDNITNAITELKKQCPKPSNETKDS